MTARILRRAKIIAIAVLPVIAIASLWVAGQACESHTRCHVLAPEYHDDDCNIIIPTPWPTSPWQLPPPKY